MPTEALIGRYRDQLLALQRPGRSRTRRPGSEIYKLMEGRAVEMARLHESADAVVEAMDPRTPGDFLGDWEEMVGLPDGCVAFGEVTVDDRIAAVVARWTDRGDTTIAALTAIAVALGYSDAAITRVVIEGATCIGTCVDPVTTEEWKLTALLTAASRGDGLDAQMMCTMLRALQIHGWMLFEFGPGLSGSFDVDTGVESA
jgi:uncharacterized protein YmfQ (DUF2313 family)